LPQAIWDRQDFWLFVFHAVNEGRLGFPVVRDFKLMPESGKSIASPEPVLTPEALPKRLEPGDSIMIMVDPAVISNRCQASGVQFGELVPRAIIGYGHFDGKIAPEALRLVAEQLAQRVSAPT
jgi:hypothetical protein